MRTAGVGLEFPREEATRRGHSAPVTTVEWSPDGKWLATGSYDGSLIIWDAKTGSVFRTFFHDRLINHVRWSHDGRFLASGSADRTCRVWNPKEGSLAALLAGRPDDVYAMAWSPDDQVLCTVSEDGTGRLWDWANGTLLDALMFHWSHCHSVDWDPISGVIATCGEDSRIRLWDGEGRLKETWRQPRDLETCRWAPGRSQLAATSDDGYVRIYNLDGSMLSELGPLKTAAKSVSWSPDGEHLAVGGYDCSCTVWQPATGRLVRRFESPRLWPRSIHWSPDDKVAIGTFDATPTIIDLDRHIGSAEGSGTRGSDVVLVPPGRPTRGINAISPAGAFGILLASDDGAVYLWNPDGSSCDPRIIGGRQEGSLVNTVAWRPSSPSFAFGTFEGIVSLQHLEDALPVSSVDVASPVNQVCWSSDGSALAVATYDGMVHLFGVKGRGISPIRSLQVHEGAIKGVAWIDSHRLVTAATDGLAKVLSTTGETLSVLRGHGSLLNAVSVSSVRGSPLVATASRDRTIRIWDPGSASCLRILLAHDESVKSVAWKPGSRQFLVTGSYDFDARVWDLGQEDEGRTSVILGGHRNAVGTVGWWGNHPVTASWDTTCSVWDASRPVPVQTASIALVDIEENDDDRA